MNNISRIRVLRFLALALVLASSLSHADVKQICAGEVITSLKTDLIIGDVSNIRASACKHWSDDKSKMLVAIAYELSGYPESTRYELPLYIIMVDANTLKILSHYKGSISEDAVTHVDQNSLKLDAARYFLSKNTRAFGLSVHANQEPKFSEGGADDYLSLYVFERSKIRPVLNGLSMRRWSYESGVPGGVTDYTARETNFTLDIAKSTSHGFADLLISAKTGGSKKTLTHLLRYDGRSYPFVQMDLWIELSGQEH